MSYFRLFQNSTRQIWKLLNEFVEIERLKCFKLLKQNLFINV